MVFSRDPVEVEHALSGDCGGWPLAPYIWKIRVSVAIGTQSGIRLHERVYTYGQNMGGLKK